MAITFVTSIPALLLYHPILHDHNYILGAGHDTRIEFAAFLEVLQADRADRRCGRDVPDPPAQRASASRLATSHRGPSNRRSSCVGLISLLSLLTLRQDLAASVGGNSGSLVIAGRTLVAIHKWTFLVGPGFCVAVNDVILGYLMYTTGLIPRRLAMFGLIGGPLIFASSTAVVFGAYTPPTGSVAGIVTIPVFILRPGFAIYLIVKGFRPSHVLSGEPAT